MTGRRGFGAPSPQTPDTASAAFDHHSPQSGMGSQVKSWALPPAITDSLVGYAKAYSFDLATPTTDAGHRRRPPTPTTEAA